MKEYIDIEKWSWYAFACIFLLMVGVSIYTIVTRYDEVYDDKPTKTLVPQQYVDRMTEFSIYYKDGHVGKCRATSVVYGVEDDKIYFLGQFKDTIQILPKVMVEDVQEKSTKVIKNMDKK